MSATFTSAGDDVVGVLFPVWRGTVRSDAVDVTLLQPSEPTLAGRRARLEACQRGGCTDSAPIEYFRHVRDLKAAEILLTLLPIYPESPAIFPAIVNQGRPADADALEAFAKGRPPAGHESEWSALRHAARTAAAELRRATPCGPGGEQK
jgi:hypothetical protein